MREVNHADGCNRGRGARRLLNPQLKAPRRLWNKKDMEHQATGVPKGCHPGNALSSGLPGGSAVRKHNLEAPCPCVFSQGLQSEVLGREPGTRILVPSSSQNVYRFLGVPRLLQPSPGGSPEISKASERWHPSFSQKQWGTEAFLCLPSAGV